MQAPPSPRTFAAPMPSFMTVFDEEASRRELDDFSGQHASEMQKPFPSNTPATTGATNFRHMNTHFSSFHQQRDSISTSASESSESSPTTTVSTLDSSSMTEPSPGPSPETPASAMPLNYAPISDAKFQAPMRSSTEPTNQQFFEMQRPSTPAKKPRNLKNLAVNTTSAYNLGRAILSAPFVSVSDQKPKERTSAPNSPVFVKPPTPPRRKLGGGLNLTIKTPANANMGIGGIIPPTPSVTKPNTLRHFQSSPSLPLLTSRDGPLGGMTLPPLKTRPAPRGFADIPIEDEEDDLEQNFDVPQSQEEKPESYPNGPIRIYEDGVDLYYEPNVEVASRYDVIFNVASEVKNPFTVASEALRSPPIAEPTENKGVLAEGPETASSPDTPKATPITTQLPAPPLPTKMPEYIHIPWEHNTDLVPDLHRLVKVIDERVQQGKRVLVHCQCGVSRSATLIVAYGIYKNPGITVQEAYDAVKKRSKWIGPNMNLIMQLQEFRSGLLRNSRGSQLFNLPRKMSTAMSSASTTGSFNGASTSKSNPVTPRTAPLPPERDDISPNRARGASMGPMSAAPLEPRQAPAWETGFRRSWGEGQVSADVDMKRISIVSDTPYVDAKGHIVPMVHVIEQDDDTPRDEVQATHSSIQITTEFPARTKSQKRKTPNFSRQLPLRRDYDGDSPMADAPPPVPEIMSPRSEEFGMIGVTPEKEARKDDSFGLFSPMQTEFPEFPSNVMTRAAPTQIQPFPSLVDPPPAAPSRDVAPAVSGFSFFDPQTPQLDPHSIMSPTTSSFPRDLPLRSGNSPTPSDSSRLTPRKNVPRALKTKFSSPNLQESKRLARLQDQIDPKRHMDDLDALMSPRATQFTSNPFHDLLAVKAGDTPIEAPQKTPVTPTSSQTDPRSPAQQGISPITRNIFDVL
jgi:tyrosine-protein phosphatase